MCPRPPLLALPLTLLALLACGETTTPSQPDLAGNPTPTELSLAAAANSWTPRATTPFGPDFHGYDLGMAPNSAGQSIVYTFGGTSEEDGSVGSFVKAYNVARNAWSGRLSEVHVWQSNGIGKIGNKLYFSGGYIEHGPGTNISTNQLWAYDVSNDRMIRKADLPIFSAEGVTGVINGKLYVLPGVCDGSGYPQPGSCAEEPTRRFYRYDPATNTWTTRRQAPHFHRHGAAAVIDGKFYVAGGFNGFQPVADLDVYDPATNSWRTLAPLPRGGAAYGTGLSGGLYVVVQGFNGTSPDHRLYAYNPATNRWTAKAAPNFFGSVTRVARDGGGSGLFMATRDKSALYTP